MRERWDDTEGGGADLSAPPPPRASLPEDVQPRPFAGFTYLRGRSRLSQLFSSISARTGSWAKFPRTDEHCHALRQTGVHLFVVGAQRGVCPRHAPFRAQGLQHEIGRRPTGQIVDQHSQIGKTVAVSVEFHSVNARSS
ncbi:hypothetical protein C7476_10327 [Phyllobacterium bourgognense]|uniref:Uncharacterized protein n=1 Tax=Phyllobacterium bourgognense TaxID=314236 RepID=A0A368Z1S9_9HYPH|nr:hypothetical protein C7476_10327 [Phyllobacterium bourgognense]